MLGAQAGLTADQVLDMNIPMLQAYLDGYQEKLFDQRCLAVHQGFWAGYYHSKKPKPPKVILKQMMRDYSKEKKRIQNKGKNIPKPDVDVEAFLERERRFKERMRNG